MSRYVIFAIPSRLSPARLQPGGILLDLIFFHKFFGAFHATHRFIVSALFAFGLMPDGQRVKRQSFLKFSAIDARTIAGLSVNNMLHIFHPSPVSPIGQRVDLEIYFLETFLRVQDFAICCRSGVLPLCRPFDSVLLVVKTNHGNLFFARLRVNQSHSVTHFSYLPFISLLKFSSSFAIILLQYFSSCKTFFLKMLHFFSILPINMIQ